MSRTGGFTADIDNVSAVPDHLLGVSESSIHMIEFSTVGKRVGSHVQNSHNISFIFCIKFTITNSHTCFLLLKFT